MMVFTALQILSLYLCNNYPEILVRFEHTFIYRTSGHTRSVAGKFHGLQVSKILRLLLKSKKHKSQEMRNGV